MTSSGSRALAWLALATVAWLSPASGDEGDPRAGERLAMVHTIEDLARATGGETGRAELAPEVLEAMAAVPRHRFVPDAVSRVAYANRPLPIGHGQTISQPYIVALMTDLLAVGPQARVLEVGTGSAYQAAVLAELVAQVHTIEIVEPLAREAEARLAALGYTNVAVRHGDGYFGWADEAPFDAIIVTAAAGHVPPPLVEQLAPGGTLVIPVGDPFSVQHLLLVRKSDAGELRVRNVLPVRFVPLTGGH